MNTYIIVITWNDPYPRKFEYRERGSSLGVGIARAIRSFRKDNKGRRIKQISLTAIQV